MRDGCSFVNYHPRQHAFVFRGGEQLDIIGKATRQKGQFSGTVSRLYLVLCVQQILFDNHKRREVTGLPHLKSVSASLLLTPSSALAERQTHPLVDRCRNVPPNHPRACTKQGIEVFFSG